MRRVTPRAIHNDFGWVGDILQVIGAGIVIVVVGYFLYNEDEGDTRAIATLSNDAFEFVEFDYDKRGSKYGPQMDRATLTFENLRTGDRMEWKGDADDALAILAHVDVGGCYFHPTDPDEVEPAPCGK